MSSSYRRQVTSEPTRAGTGAVSKVPNPGPKVRTIGLRARVLRPQRTAMDTWSAGVVDPRGATVKPLLVILFVIGGMFAAPLPATADTPHCVVRSEFRHVHNGLSRVRVRRIFDTGGRLNSIAGGHEVRTYRACHRPRQSFVSVHFGNGRVIAKFAVWG
jgi:hypothetical protein